MTKLATIPTGNDHTLAAVCQTVRSDAQHQVVSEIVNSPEFDFACSNPFVDDEKLRDYRRHFYFLWFDKQHHLNLARITWTGKVTRRLVVGDDGKAKDLQVN